MVVVVVRGNGLASGLYSVVRQLFKTPNFRLWSACTLLGKRKFLLRGKPRLYSLSRSKGNHRWRDGGHRRSSWWGGHLCFCVNGNCGNDRWPVPSSSLEEKGFLHRLVALG